jgi:hypothetical protein
MPALRNYIELTSFKLIKDIGLLFFAPMVFMQCPVHDPLLKDADGYYNRQQNDSQK